MGWAVEAEEELDEDEVEKPERESSSSSSSSSVLSMSINESCRLNRWMAEAGPELDDAAPPRWATGRLRVLCLSSLPPMGI